MTRILVRSITPERGLKLDPRRFSAAVKNELASLGREGVSLFKKPVRNWARKPDFEYTILAHVNYVTLHIFPVGPYAEKFDWIDFGTGPRTINAKPGKTMKFKTGYRASTVPGSLTSRTARRYTPWRSATAVWHSIAPRGFSEQVYDILLPQFRRRMENVIRREIRAGVS